MWPYTSSATRGSMFRPVLQYHSEERGKRTVHRHEGNCTFREREKELPEGTEEIFLVELPLILPVMFI